MLELYHASHSTCSQKVRLCLAEKGLDWVDRPISFDRRDHLDPEYLKLNPNGVVPTLVHDGVPLIESSVLVEYLDEVFPAPPLSPSGATGRARMRAWLRYIDEVPTVAVRVPSFTHVFAPMRFGRLTDADFAKHAERLPLRRQFYRKMSQKGFGEDEMDNALRQIRQTAERIAAAVEATGGPYVMGKRLTLPDITLTPSIERMADLGYAWLWERDLPATVAWRAAIRARPSFETAFYVGSHMSEKYPEFFDAGGALSRLPPFEERRAG
ncbi:MAG: glutathione S-transferase family protein [Alphaproteobacteria bacterium]